MYIYRYLKMVNLVLVRYLYRGIDGINYIHNTPRINRLALYNSNILYNIF